MGCCEFEWTWSIGSSHGMLFDLERDARHTAGGACDHASLTLPFAITSRDPTIKTVADLEQCKKIPLPSLKVSRPAVAIEMGAVQLYGLQDFARFLCDDHDDVARVDATIVVLTGSGVLNSAVATAALSEAAA